MLFALNYVNQEVEDGLREVALDAVIMDTCSNGISSTDAVLNMMKEAERDGTTIAGEQWTTTFFCEIQGHN